jgi:putative ABC transport system ATP-binding protein
LNQASDSAARSAIAPLIEVKNASRMFKLSGEEVYAVRNVTLNVLRGRFVTLVGRSGSGKTTLLNLLAGLDHPTEGQVLFEGRDMAAFSEKEFIQLRRNRVGVVFQSFALLPLLSAYENVELPLRIAGIGASERSRRTGEVLEMVGLSRRAGHRPYELSGGEQQRISIARAVAIQPDIILADEPTGELDSRNANSIFGLFHEMAKDRGMTVVATTHDRTLLDMADEIYEISDGMLNPIAGGKDPQSMFKRPKVAAAAQSAPSRPGGGSPFARPK